MLVEFPSVVNAVACAAEVQRGVRDRNKGVPPDRRIEFRIGVNVGDVIVQGEDILGDGVNVAARLESIAPPGGITISGPAREWSEWDERNRRVRAGLALSVRVAGELRRLASQWRTRGIAIRVSEQFRIFHVTLVAFSVECW